MAALLTCKKSVLHFQVYNGTSETTASCCISELLTFPSVLLKYCILILSRPHESEILRTVFLEISYTRLSQLKNFTSISYHNETNSEHKAEGPHEELGLLWSAIQRSWTQFCSITIASLHIYSCIFGPFDKFCCPSSSKDTAEPLQHNFHDGKVQSYSISSFTETAADWNKYSYKLKAG